MCTKIHKDLNPPVRLLRIPPLDRIISTVFTASSSAAFTVDPRSESVVPSPPIQIKDLHPVIEITGTSTACGKSHIIYYIAALSILPEDQNNVSLDGKDSAVVIFDTDGRYDVRRQFTVIKSYILQRYHIVDETVVDANIDCLIKTAMKHIHVYRPQSTLDMIEMLNGLRVYLLDLDSHYSASRPLDCVLIDSISAFYWQDRLAGLVSQKGTPGYQERYQILVKKLQEISASFGAFIVATNWGLQHHEPLQEDYQGSGVAHVGVQRPGDNIIFRSHLPAAWNKFVDIKLVVKRDVITPFRQGISIIEALNERQAMFSPNYNDNFSGQIDVCSFKTAMQELFKGKNGRFHYRIGESGIFFVA